MQAITNLQAIKVAFGKTNSGALTIGYCLQQDMEMAARTA